MSDHRLRLYPRDPHAEPVGDDLMVRTLRTAGLIGREVEAAGARRYRTGPRFLELVSFGGDATAVRCTVEVPEAVEQIDFLGGANVEDPDCRGCGILVDRRTISAANDVACDGCGSIWKPWDLDWHRSNAFGRYTVDVHGIGLGDAVPAPELLRALEGTNGVLWDYFYYSA